MKCPQTFQIEIQAEGELRLAGAECDRGKCAWYDERKKQCAILTLAQKDNSKISVAR